MAKIEIGEDLILMLLVKRKPDRDGHDVYELVRPVDMNDVLKANGALNRIQKTLLNTTLAALKNAGTKDLR